MDEAVKKVYKELLQINRKGVFDDNAHIEPYDPDKPLCLKVVLTPSEGVYAGGSFEFKLSLPSGYPNVGVPSVTCKTRIYHPNISNNTICFSMLSEGNKGYDLEQYVNGLLWLLYNPNLESRLNSRVTSDPILFPKNVLLSMMGETVDGVKYEKVLNKVTPCQETSIFFLRLLNGGQVTRLAQFPLESVKLELSKIGTPKFTQILPLYEKLSQESIFYFCNIRQCHTVSKRAKFLETSPKVVLKEMVIEIEGELGLVLTSSTEKLNVEALSKMFEKNVTVSKAKLAKQKGIEVKHVSIFEKNISNIFINYDIMQHEFVYTAGGLKNTFIKVRPSDILKLRPEAVVLHSITLDQEPIDSQQTEQTQGDQIAIQTNPAQVVTQVEQQPEQLIQVPSELVEANPIQIQVQIQNREEGVHQGYEVARVPSTNLQLEVF